MVLIENIILALSVILMVIFTPKITGLIYAGFYKIIEMLNSVINRIYKPKNKKNKHKKKNNVLWLEDYFKIFKYFGYENQRRKLVEEINELNDEILLFEKGIGDIQDLKEELADCYILLKQFKEYYEITDEELMVIIRYKLNRTLERIEGGYYKTNN